MPQLGIEEVVRRKMGFVQGYHPWFRIRAKSNRLVYIDIEIINYVITSMDYVLHLAARAQ